MSETRELTIRDRLQSDALTTEIAKVLPSHLTPQRMVRVTLTALTRTPDLAKCDQASFFKCLMDLSALGLEPDGRRAHLIPFKNNKRNCIECQLIVDYKGLVELAYRSGLVSHIHADLIREGDLFAYSMGDVQEHVPHFLRRDADKPPKAGSIVGAYCRAVLKDGASKTEVLSSDEIEAIRKRSRAGQSGPWVSDWGEMAKKTAFRRVSKWLPLSSEYRDAVERDDDVIDGVVVQPARKAIDLRQAAKAAAADLQALLESKEPEAAESDSGAVLDAETHLHDQTTAFDPVADLRAAIEAVTDPKQAAELAPQAEELGLLDVLDAKIMSLRKGKK